MIVLVFFSKKCEVEKIGNPKQGNVGTMECVQL
jgi:hypothetical protein